MIDQLKHKLNELDIKRVPVKITIGDASFEMSAPDMPNAIDEFKAAIVRMEETYVNEQIIKKFGRKINIEDCIWPNKFGNKIEARIVDGCNVMLVVLNNRHYGDYQIVIGYLLTGEKSVFSPECFCKPTDFSRNFAKFLSKSKKIKIM